MGERAFFGHTGKSSRSFSRCFWNSQRRSRESPHPILAPRGFGTPLYLNTKGLPMDPCTCQAVPNVPSGAVEWKPQPSRGWTSSATTGGLHSSFAGKCMWPGLCQGEQRSAGRTPALGEKPQRLGCGVRWRPSPIQKKKSKPTEALATTVGKIKGYPFLQIHQQQLSPAEPGQGCTGGTTQGETPSLPNAPNEDVGVKIGAPGNTGRPGGVLPPVNHPQGFRDCRPAGIPGVAHGDNTHRSNASTSSALFDLHPDPCPQSANGVPDKQLCRCGCRFAAGTRGA